MMGGSEKYFITSFYLNKYAQVQKLVCPVVKGHIVKARGRLFI